LYGTFYFNTVSNKLTVFFWGFLEAILDFIRKKHPLQASSSTLKAIGIELKVEKAQFLPGIGDIKK
jgi:hypothetical protein